VRGVHSAMVVVVFLRLAQPLNQGGGPGGGGGGGSQCGGVVRATYIGPVQESRMPADGLKSRL